jgi:hypothetical protein
MSAAGRAGMAYNPNSRLYIDRARNRGLTWSWPSNAIHHARFRIYILVGLLNIMANAFEPGQAFWSSADACIPQSVRIGNSWNEARRLAKAGRFTLWNVDLFHWTNREAYKGGTYGA